jgi:hypothetical protein
MRVTENPNDSYLMHVECISGAATRQEVLLLLRRARARDVHVDDTGTSATIEAAYYKTDNAVETLEGIASDLRQIGTVIYVELRDNPRLIRETR